MRSNGTLSRAMLDQRSSSGRSKAVRARIRDSHPRSRVGMLTNRHRFIQLFAGDAFEQRQLDSADRNGKIRHL